jgi:hypothetical protein
MQVDVQAEEDREAVVKYVVKELANELYTELLLQYWRASISKAEGPREKMTR